MAYRCHRQPSIGPRERSSFSGIASLRANLAWLRLVWFRGIISCPDPPIKDTASFWRWLRLRLLGKYSILMMNSFRAFRVSLLRLPSGFQGLLRLPSGFQGLLRFCEKNLSWKWEKVSSSQGKLIKNFKGRGDSTLPPAWILCWRVPHCTWNWYIFWRKDQNLVKIILLWR